ncbi:hypothetical protein EX30DRAFT_340551 [Ascodesmis nigricans]|uniref:Uncharacterized protein n=1 Tax=Ascodesmis nigricans TaxID=341454 RepID=A0A4S2MYA9_9PEZI|nr:hypothetical protein EX30DRAFT_340551 [Ascodesmis nigricans]
MSVPTNTNPNPAATTTASTNIPASTGNPMTSTTADRNPYINNPTATTMGSKEPPAYDVPPNYAPNQTVTSAEKPKGLGHSIKHGFTAVHGIGEEARGRFNGAVDGAFHNTEGVERNKKITDEGILEQETGNWGEGTKAREGFGPVPRKY